jgi:sterol 24-C-methyltransferase
MRNICRFTGMDVTGLTLNQYQVDRGNELCHEQRDTLGDDQLRCRSVQGDFMDMPFVNATFDAAYAIEATCHAPDRVGVYSEIYRVLKPGAIFACHEWCMTDKYIPGQSEA